MIRRIVDLIQADGGVASRRQELLIWRNFQSIDGGVGMSYGSRADAARSLPEAYLVIKPGGCQNDAHYCCAWSLVLGDYRVISGGGRRGGAGGWRRAGGRSSRVKADAGAAEATPNKCDSCNECIPSKSQHHRTTVVVQQKEK